MSIESQSDSECSHENSNNVAEIESGSSFGSEFSKSAIEEDRAESININVKGGGVDDLGAVYDMCVTKKFSYEYVDYARRAGVELGDLWLEYRTKYLSPNDTPLKCKMHGNDVVLAYLKVSNKHLLSPLYFTVY